jgi:hypothetical protein
MLTGLLRCALKDLLRGALKDLLRYAGAAATVSYLTNMWGALSQCH